MPDNEMPLGTILIAGDNEEDREFLGRVLRDALEATRSGAPVQPAAAAASVRSAAAGASAAVRMAAAVATMLQSA